MRTERSNAGTPTCDSLLVREGRRRISQGQVQLGIHPGHHRLTVAAEGYQPKSWEIEAEPATVHRRELVLSTEAAAETRVGVPTATATHRDGTSRAEATHRDVAATDQHNQHNQLNHTHLYNGAAATGAFALGAIATGLVAVSKKHHFEDINDGSRSDAAQSAKHSMRTFAIVSDVCTGAAVISAGITLYYYFHDRASPMRATSGASAHHTGWRGSPSATRNQLGVTLWRSF